MKEELPKVQFANPELDVRVNKVPRSPQDSWKAEMQLDFSEFYRRSFIYSPSLRLHFIAYTIRWTRLLSI